MKLSKRESKLLGLCYRVPGAIRTSALVTVGKLRDAGYLRIVKLGSGAVTVEITAAGRDAYERMNPREFPAEAPRCGRSE